MPGESRTESTIGEPPPWIGGAAPTGAPSAGKRVTWADLGPQTLTFAAAQIMRRCRVSREEAKELVADAAARIMRLGAHARAPHRLLIVVAERGFQKELLRRSREGRDLASTDESEYDHEALRSAGTRHDTQDACGLMAEAEQRDRCHSRVRNALEGLAPADRSLIEAFYFEHRAIDDLSTEASRSRAAIKTRLWRARERLRTHLGNRDPRTLG